MKTYSPKPEHIEHRWYVVDASGQVLGRLASEVATLLRGKHKPMYAPHMDTGDHVIVINADKIELTGNKATQKVAYRHSGYPGGITGVRYDQMLSERPVATIEKAVRGMLPKNRLGRQMIKKLHVVAGPEHPHQAQKPVDLAVGERPAWEGLPVPAPKAAAPAKAASARATTVVEEEAPEAPAKKKRAPAKQKAPAKDAIAEAEETAEAPDAIEAVEPETAETPDAETPDAETPDAETPDTTEE